jgi:Zn-finger nucleic acid-binding protein
MNSIPKTIKLFLICLSVLLSCGEVISQTSSEQQKPELVRLKLTDGTYLTVDEAWETSQGIWYRQGSLSHLAPGDRVKAIERGDPAPTPEQKQWTNHNSNNNDGPLYMRPVEKPPAPVVESNPGGNFERPVWIYLVGGARIEADSANEGASGVWLKRGAMSVFIERSRLDRIELEDAEKIAVDDSGKKERGWSTGRAGLDSLIRQNGIRHGVDPYLIFLVMEQESHFNARVVSPKGARGLMQLMPGTGARFGVRHPFDPAQNISGGTRYLRELLNRFDNRVDLVLASYNAGEGAVIKFGHKVPPYKETRNYVKQISYRYRRLPVRTKAVAAAGTTAGER